jgi:hypothetical protein
MKARLSILAALTVAVMVDMTEAKGPRRSETAESWVEPSRIEHPDQCELRDWYWYSKDAKVEGIRKCRLLAEFFAFVVERQACRASEDCRVLQTDCLYSCGGLPVNKARVVEVQARIEELDKTLARHLDAKCRCRLASHSICVDGRCLAARR